MRLPRFDAADPDSVEVDSVFMSTDKEICTRGMVILYELCSLARNVPEGQADQGHHNDEQERKPIVSRFRAAFPES